MKKYGYCVVILLLAMGCASAPEEDGDDYFAPYLFPEDTAVTETAAPGGPAEIPPPAGAGSTAAPVAAIESPRPAASPGSPQYHLLILDRMNAVNADISGGAVIYKFLHGANGYLIALYVSGSGNPVLPGKAKVLVDYTNASKSNVKAYIDSAAFRKYVTNRKITEDLQAALSAYAGA